MSSLNDQKIKLSISQFILQVMQDQILTQAELAERLGIKQAVLGAYISCKNLMGVDKLLKLAQYSGVAIDEIVQFNPLEEGNKRRRYPDELKEQAASYNMNNTGTINNSGTFNNIGRDQVNIHADRVNKRYGYTPKPGDLTPAQANKIMQLVNEIVELERTVKIRARSHAAVYSGLKNKFKVSYYREIPESQYPQAEAYLYLQRGRLLKAKQTQSGNDPDVRKTRYKQIHQHSKNCNFTANDLKAYVQVNYSVNSLSELSMDQLDSVYNYFLKLSKKM